MSERLNGIWKRKVNTDPNEHNRSAKYLLYFIEAENCSIFKFCMKNYWQLFVVYSMLIA